MKKKAWLLLFIFIILVSTVGLYVAKADPETNLHQVILGTLSGAKGKYSVAVVDLKSGRREFLYADKVYEVGSLYKLWVMATAFQQMQNGKLFVDEVLSRDVKELNNEFNIDTETAELTEGTITMTVKDALKQMITISHNYSALMLTEKIKLSNVAKFLKENGFNTSHVGDVPTSTASDIALFFEKLYRGELADAQYTKEMLDLLKAQSINDKLPKHLPEGTVIAHKTGEINYLSHDGGIIYAPTGDYVIVVLTESDYPPGAKERIAQISKSVFDYFSDFKLIGDGS